MTRTMFTVSRMLRTKRFISLPFVLTLVEEDLFFFPGKTVICAFSDLVKYMIYGFLPFGFYFIVVVICFCLREFSIGLWLFISHFQLSSWFEEINEEVEDLVQP